MYAFEGVLLVRKLALAISLSAFFGAPRLRLVGCLAVILCSAGSSRATRPYSAAFHNLVENVALGGLAAILSVGVMSGNGGGESPQSGAGVATALFVFVLVYLAGLLGLWVWDVRREILEGKGQARLFTVEGVLPSDREDQDGLGGSSSCNNSTIPPDLQSVQQGGAVASGGGGVGHEGSGGSEWSSRSSGKALPPDLQSVCHG